MIGTPFQQEVLRKLSGLSPVYIIGGAVRDSLLGFPSKDLDVVTVLPLDQIVTKLSNWGYKPHTIGVHQPTVSLFQGKDRLDIATFSGDLEKDALRRDFTINAIFQDVKTGEIKDPLCGLQALKEKRLESCGGAEERFQEDGIRILRLIRFAVRYGFDIAPNTWQAAVKQISLLKGVALERVTEELAKILMLEEIENALGLLDDLGYFKMYIPELARLKGLIQNQYHTKDAWDHTRRVVKNAPSTVLLRLAALLHDIGKWETASRECFTWGEIKASARGYTVNEFNLIGKNLKRWLHINVEVHGGKLDNYPDTIVVKRIKPVQTSPEKHFEMVLNGKRHFLQHERESARLVKEFLTRFRWSMVLPGGTSGERELHFLVGHHMQGTLTFMSELKGEIHSLKTRLKARRFAWEIGWDGQSFNSERVENLLDLWKADFLGGKQDAEDNLYRLEGIQSEIRSACTFLKERSRLLNWKFFEGFAREKGLEAEMFGQFKEQVRKRVMFDDKYSLTDLRFLEKEYNFYCKSESSARNNRKPRLK
ncbi:CCA tRNA nucleotidyltransferase [Desulfosporosinus meridiei]|uniref:tRNA nucleotidyltransferase/poly(A) polymerase n=1 Tax=Desulfosporosinus meridiei (strain ATCC BAA-275 / DSM 13257 / KCTC 12902 / NCIMB 13706 / S10) TaxID=768704 RepID=J7ISY4_DESMD|nr:CCA tRNA nucleotidyltransferase [Desulfosporosinus meridiei]AFQ44780.1 tRNA nucleotidyltransferase/poly(A) polymerase [Desulfosporosinus meridiei DSM 13257]